MKIKISPVLKHAGGFMRVQNTLTTVLFGLEIKFVLNIESNTLGI